jgi:hypothetical protein
VDGTARSEGVRVVTRNDSIARQLPDGTSVMAHGRLDVVPPDRERPPDVAPYLDERWTTDPQVTWPYVAWSGPQLRASPSPTELPTRQRRVRIAGGAHLHPSSRYATASST